MKGRTRMDHLKCQERLLLIFLVVCLGCGSGVELAPCRGTVSYEGSVVDSGKVLFTPTGKGPAALSKIESDGSFQLSTVSAGEGAIPGTYRVTVVGDYPFEGKEVHMACTIPKNEFVTVVADQDNEFQIEVSKEAGWQIAIDE